MLRYGEIVAEMHLLIDLLAVVHVAAHVSEGGLRLRVRLPGEGLRPQKAFGGLEAQSGQGFVVGLTHLGIDLDEALDGVAGAVRIELAQDLLHKLVRDLYLVLCVDGLFLLGEDDGQRRGYVVAGSVRSVRQRCRPGRADLATMNVTGGYTPADV